MEQVKQYVVEIVTEYITTNDVVIFSASYCTFCDQVKELFTRLGVKYFAIETDKHAYGNLIKEHLYRKTKQRNVPSVFIFGVHIGNWDAVSEKYKNGTLQDYLGGKYKSFQYDLIVIGGGSAGIAAAKEAAILKKKVALFDYVKPSPKGTAWGAGGTCLNVGCIPKKLFHQAALIGRVIDDSSSFGWELNPSKKKQHNWTIMIENIQDQIQKLRSQLLIVFKKLDIHYFNAYASFKNIHTVKTVDVNGEFREYTGHRFLLACGTRPHIPDFPGNNYAITSDDLFSLATKPGKTLVVGASYIALECAGILHGVGINCTLLVRSILLRGFDQQIAEMIESHFVTIGVKIIRGFVPVGIHEGVWDDVDPDLKYKVSMMGIGPYESQEREEYYNTILLATGRDVVTEGLGLDIVGIKLTDKTGRIETDRSDLSACHTVYVAGDMQEGHMALTPIAIKSAQQIVRRLFANGTHMDYQLTPTTVFTPLEYGVCGYSEEQAVNIYGDDIECYHIEFQPVEWLLAVQQQRCYCKLVCLKSTKLILGIHILGPNAGEITQGFELALKKKVTVCDFERLVAVHPTSAEAFATMYINHQEPCKKRDL